MHAMHVTQYMVECVRECTSSKLGADVSSCLKTHITTTYSTNFQSVLYVVKHEIV